MGYHAFVWCLVTCVVTAWWFPKINNQNSLILCVFEEYVNAPVKPHKIPHVLKTTWSVARDKDHVTVTHAAFHLDIQFISAGGGSWTEHIFKWGSLGLELKTVVSGSRSGHVWCECQVHTFHLQQIQTEVLLFVLLICKGLSWCIFEPRENSMSHLVSYYFAGFADVLKERFHWSPPQQDNCNKVKASCCTNIVCAVGSLPRVCQNLGGVLKFKVAIMNPKIWGKSLASRMEVVSPPNQILKPPTEGVWHLILNSQQTEAAPPPLAQFSTPNFEAFWRRRQHWTFDPMAEFLTSPNVKTPVHIICPPTCPSLQ